MEGASGKSVFRYKLSTFFSLLPMAWSAFVSAAISCVMSYCGFIKGRRCFGILPTLSQAIGTSSDCLHAQQKQFDHVGAFLPRLFRDEQQMLLGSDSAKSLLYNAVARIPVSLVKEPSFAVPKLRAGALLGLPPPAIAA
ncbi:MAG: hypothetical protein ACAI35_12125 [Candidatus Methylacidiphilales bacterium]|nr:hypothetical protein [Candidatus Methylacidiphilales bacterium]